MSIGRGLGALITPTNSRKSLTLATGGNNADRVWQVPISEVKPNPNQPRRNFRPEELNELSESIKEHGVLQPILVAERTDGGYEIIAGERRWRASQIAGLATIPVIVKKLAEQQKVEVALIENIQRSDLNPIEEAFAYRRLMDEFGLTQEEVSNKVGKSRPTVANAVRLLDLPEEVKTALIEGKINTGQARALLTLRDEKERLSALTSMLGQKISVREVERESIRKNPAAGRRDPNLLYLEDKMRTALGAKVAVSQKGEKGTITISYFSKQELSDIIKKITS